MSGSNQYSAVVSRLSRRAVVNGGRADAVSRQLGERLRAEYLRIMSEQTEKHGDEPDWFRAQLGGRDTVAAIDTALAAGAALPSPDASAAAAPSSVDARLEFTMQGRTFSFPAGSDSVIFIGREPRCDAVMTPETDRTTSRISAILYPQPTRGLLLVCDPGNLSGIRVVSRERTQLGLPRSVPFSRTILPLPWSERVDLDVCGMPVRLFTRDAAAASSSPAAAAEGAAPVEADDAPRRRKVARRTERDAATATASSSAVAESPRVAAEPPAAPDEARRCVVCLDRPRGCCFLPCRHQVCCVACAQASPLCPICRTAVEVAMPMVLRPSERSYDAAIVPHAALRKRKDILDSPFRSAMAW